MEFHGGFMSKEERINNWHKIVETAKKVIFIDGDSKKYHNGDIIGDLPDCTDFHIFIQY